MNDEQKQTAALRLILAMAPSFQGGNSKTGGEVADYLGIPFPPGMASLEQRARASGFDPNDLWPWRRHPKVEAGTNG